MCQSSGCDVNEGLGVWCPGIEDLSILGKEWNVGLHEVWSGFEHFVLFELHQREIQNAPLQVNKYM